MKIPGSGASRKLQLMSPLGELHIHHPHPAFQPKAPPARRQPPSPAHTRVFWDSHAVFLELGNPLGGSKLSLDSEVQRAGAMLRN